MVPGVMVPGIMVPDAIVPGVRVPVVMVFISTGCHLAALAGRMEEVNSSLSTSGSSCCLLWSARM